MVEPRWRHCPKLVSITVPLLRNAPQVCRFLEKELKYLPENEIPKLAEKIAEIENGLHGKSSDGSMWSSPDRHPDCREGYKRLRLHANIVEQAIPKTPHRDARQRQAFLVIGGPGTGKSRVSELLCAEAHGLLIDADNVKKELPEYEGGDKCTSCPQRVGLGR